MNELELRAIIDADLAHQIHPQYHTLDHGEPVVLVRGEGSTLWDARGKEYIDGLSCLWNVAVGHGRRELAQAAAQQMEQLAFANNYVGYTNVPSVKLAERLMSLVYPDMQGVFFSNSGSEAVELALKLARYYWFLQDKPDKVKIICRKEAYHGGTYGATAATGLAPFHQGFGPLPPGFVRVGTCYPYRCERCDDGADPGDCGVHCANEVDRAIEAEGAATVAAVIAEPVHGAGGVIPPADGYWQRLREICDRHNVLLIADEVITGFGRTGRWFALEHWGVQPDMMTVAKAITSAYVPLAATIFSGAIHEAIRSAPTTAKLMHGYTNAGHPTACAVALRNLDIIEDECLVERAATLGERLFAELQSLRDLPHVGDVRGLGLIAGVELVADKETKAPFDPALGIGPKLFRDLRERGLLVRMKGESILLAPPLVVTESEVDHIVETVGAGINGIMGV